MIYYYFGGKEALYLAVLEAAYRSIRRIEATLDLETPVARRPRCARWSPSPSTTRTPIPNFSAW